MLLRTPQRFLAANVVRHKKKTLLTMFIERIIDFIYKRLRLFPLWVLLLIFLSSCVGPYMLQYTLRDYKVPLNYNHDSKIDTIKSNRKVYIRVIDNLRTNDTTKVKNDGFLLVPFVIMGGYKGDFMVTLGKRNVTPTFREFVYSSFLTEANRSGKFRPEKRAFRSDYTLRITLHDCQISAPYHKDRIRYSTYSRENWVLKPVTGKFIIEIQLIGKRNVVFEKTYLSVKSSQLKTQEFKSEYEMNKKMMEDFVQTASLEIKELLENIVRDVNEFVE